MAEEQSQALRDALVLLHVFASSSWRSLEIASGGMRLSISRTSAAEREILHTASRLTPPMIETVERLLAAPHVASLQAIAAVGATVKAGEIYATLEVLDKTIELYGDESFLVTSQQSRPGDLLEFGSPLINIKIM